VADVGANACVVAGLRPAQMGQSPVTTRPGAIHSVGLLMMQQVANAAAQVL
jgi:hypothetical protein